MPILVDLKNMGGRRPYRPSPDQGVLWQGFEQIGVDFAQLASIRAKQILTTP